MAKGLADTGLDGLRIKGQKLSARVLDAVLDAEIERTIDGASTLTLRLQDEDRQLLRSSLFASRATMQIDDLRFDTVALNKAGSQLAVTAESAGVAALRRHHGPLAAKKRSSTTRTAFARRLVNKVKWLDFRGEVGDPAQVALAVGTDGNREETYWEALKRLADDRNWRCFESEDTVFFGSDDWLHQLTDPFVVSEDDEGVDTIDFDYDGGKRASSATIYCWASRWASRPGEPVRLRRMGALGSGVWLVESIRRSLFSQQTTVTLTRKTPELPEPTAASETTGGVLGGLGAPASGVFQYCPVPGGRVNNDFGAPRVGHTHQGNDIFAPSGTPIIAVFDGTLDVFDSGICGKGFHVRGAAGYVLGCHLSSFARSGGPIRAGELIGYVGNTGNAATTPPHLHFEWHPGGGAAIDPYGLLTAVCGG